jgi:hypothetical protein
MEVMSKNKLYELTLQNMKRMEEEVIENIVKSVYNQVIHYSLFGTKTTIHWAVSTDYIFGNSENVKFVHIVRAVVRLQQLFPDSKVYQVPPLGISVDWS